MNSLRNDHDTWDITESVGATALGMASARAQETGCAETLFVDTYAQVFLDEAVRLGWKPPSTPEPAGRHADPVLRNRMRMLSDYAACRTKYFDDFIVRAIQAGMRQVVVLGAGLDSRPGGCRGQRTPWCSRSITLRCCGSNIRPCRHTTSNPPAYTDRYPSTCAMIGPPRCAVPDSTFAGRRRG